MSSNPGSSTRVISAAPMVQLCTRAPYVGRSEPADRFRTMCGRYVSATPPDQIAAYFGAEAPEALLAPSYNVAPTSDVYAVLSDGSTAPRRRLPLGPGARSGPRTPRSAPA